MRSASTIPQSQRSRIRPIARAAWIESGGNLDNACGKVAERIPRGVGGAWAQQAIAMALEFCDYWDKKQILEPAQVHVFGEPGSDFFESDEE